MFRPLLFLVFTASALALPLPQPVLFIPQSVVKKVESLANLEFVRKTVRYQINKAEIYRLLSGERFKYIDPSSVSLEVEKTCFYAIDKTDNSSKKLYCYINYIKDLKTGQVVYSYTPTSEEIKEKIEKALGISLDTTTSTSSSIQSIFTW